MGSASDVERILIGLVELVDASGNTLAVIDGPNRQVVLPAGTAFTADSLDTTELGLLNGATAGSLTASKVVTRDAGSRIPFQTGAPAAAGTTAATATAITADENHVTGADGTKGVILPVGVVGMRIEVENSVTTATALLKVYPDTGGTINGAAADAAFSVAPGARAIFVCTAASTWFTAPNDAALVVTGVAAAYKVARGVSAVTGTATVATGLATVIAVSVTAQDDLDGDALAGVSATVGDQAGAPVAGSVVLKAWKVTAGGAAGNPTLIAATVAKNLNWIAVGT